MQHQLTDEIYAALVTLPLIDPHTHINPHQPASETLADLLGYHYYTELAHSAGLARDEIEAPNLDPKERVARLIPSLVHLDNTVQVSWLLEMARSFFDFDEPRITTDNWESLYDTAVEKMQSPDWEADVLEQSNLEQVYLTNDFDDPLEGWDTTKYVPCLRTDELVFHLHQASVRDRLSEATDVELNDVAGLGRALGKLFERFTQHGARACAISLPPDFEPLPIDDREAETPLERLLAQRDLSADGHKTLERYVFWKLAQLCSEFHLPFDLMIGVNRSVYEGGVQGGQDLFDSRVSLYPYRRLFNALPEVTFPVSVLASGLNQELVSTSWIFPNVICFGHWWYSNVPTYLRPDTQARLQAVPRTKQIGYYSDMYKLEFALPKFNMYRRVLADLLVEDFVYGRGWSEEEALELGRQILRGNVEQVFGGPRMKAISMTRDPEPKTAMRMDRVGQFLLGPVTSHQPRPSLDHHLCNRRSMSVQGAGSGGSGGGGGGGGGGGKSGGRGGEGPGGGARRDKNKQDDPGRDRPEGPSSSEGTAGSGGQGPGRPGGGGGGGGGRTSSRRRWRPE